MTLFNPNKALVKLWPLKYDLEEMPPSKHPYVKNVPLDENDLSGTTTTFITNAKLSETFNNASSLVLQQERLAYSTGELSIKTPSQDQIIHPNQVLRDG